MPSRPAPSPRPVPTRVLFVCTGNSGRSQMAEALLAAWGGADFDAASAGTAPAGVSPFTVKALAELGIDWHRAQSKPLARFLGRPFDVVITLCDSAREACPVFPGPGVSLHWDIDDPADAVGSEAIQLAAYRTAREAIAAHLQVFLAQRRP
ncbi:MAG: arsenate reductase ArsC [Candidatus Limnocylindrales bacterium]